MPRDDLVDVSLVRDGVINQVDGLFSFGFVPTQVGNGGLHKSDVFLEVANPNVAEVAEKSAYFPGGVTVIDMQSAHTLTGTTRPTRLFTDTANSALFLEDLIPFFQIYSVLKLKVVGLLSAGIAISLKSLRRVFGDYDSGVKSLSSAFAGGRSLRAARLVVCHGVKAIFLGAIRTRDERPSIWPGADMLATPGSAYVLRPPFFIPSEIAILTGRIEPIVFVNRLREVRFIDKLLAYRTNFLVCRFFWGAGAAASNMAKKAFGRYRFSAPNAFDCSLCYFRSSGHLFSWIAKIESLKFEYKPCVLGCQQAVAN